VAGNKTDFAASFHRFRATEMLPLKSFSLAVTIYFYALWHSPRDSILLYVRPLVCPLVSAQLSLDRFPCSFLLETCIEIFLETEVWLKPVGNMGHFT